MRLIGQDVLVKALRKHADAKKWIEAWVATVEDAHWQSGEDLRADYPSADGVKLPSDLVVTVFNVKGNVYRLLTSVNYVGQVFSCSNCLRTRSTTRRSGKVGTEMATATPRTAPQDSYMRLIEELPLRRITSAAAYARAKRIALRLANAHPDRGASEYLDVLVDLIADYERRSEQAVDASGVTPAELIRHRIGERGMSVSALARLIGIPQSNLSQMLSGHRDWSKAAIRALSKHLNIRPDRFFI